MSNQLPLPGSMNLPFVEELYDRYLANPHSVSAEWRQYFQQLASGDGRPRRQLPSPPVAPPASKEWTLMATQFDTPKMFTDMNDQAKTAVEKSQKLAAEMGDFGKGNIEAMVESSKIAAKGMETMGQDVAEYTRKSFEGMTATLKTMASVKSPTELFKIQSDYARSAFDAAIAQTSKNTEMMVKLTSDAVQPISSRFAVAVEKVKLAA